jgi:hypothetical protein
MNDQEIQDWLDLRESPKEIGGLVCYVRSEDVRLLLCQLREQLSATAQEPKQ